MQINWGRPWHVTLETLNVAAARFILVLVFVALTLLLEWLRQEIVTLLSLSAEPGFSTPNLVIIVVEGCFDISFVGTAAIIAIFDVIDTYRVARKRV